jgi:hypothetical protein
MSRSFVWLLPLCLLAATSPVAAAPKTVEFNRDVRPIFSEYCSACHGPDTAKRKASLRLDVEDGGVKKVVVPGKPEKSELYERITADGKGHMPPLSTNKALSKGQIALIKAWIEQGAKYQKHWAFISPIRPEPPKVKDEKWAANAIDRFILARLEAEGLKPSVQADRRTLARRLSFDLTGLPPAPEDVDAFVADTSEKAYRKYVSKLLSSRHYGERMALYWLDLVRYGDTGGYHSDNHRDVSLYRDWVIDSFNSNKKFDVFTREQLAGDLLPDAGPEQKIASGYNRLLMTTEEGGAQAKEYTAKYAADRVRNASAVWLGLTMGCCECHNHKYDPVTTKEFYQFAAFWADVAEVAVGRQPQTKMPTREQAARLKLIEAQVADLRKTLETPTPALAFAQKEWEAKAKADLAETKSSWSAVKPAKLVSSGGATLTASDDGSVVASGANPDKDTYTVTLSTDLKNVTGIRLSALRHNSFDGLSRGNGNFVLTGFSVSVEGKEKKLTPVKLASAQADFSQQSFPVASLLKPRGAGWAVEGHNRKGEDRQAVFVFARPIPGGPGTTLVVKMEHNSIYAKHNVGRFRLDLTTAEKPHLGDKGGLPQAIVAALTADPTKRDEAQRDALAVHYRSISPLLAPTRTKIAALEQERAAIEKTMPQTLVTTSASPRTMRVLRRGNWLDDAGEVVAPGTPAVLSPLASKGKRATRLDLANWLTAKDHPLTARVFVNRVWKVLFGKGLLTSLEDYGAQGGWPSHPELLDWLAVEFRESGWDVQHLVTLIVTSSTYRQSSVANAELRERDPANNLLARQGRFRLDAEMVRDNALAVSGLLSGKIGGPSVKPYQPAGYWAYLNFPTRTYVDDKGEDQYRRGLYTYWQRTFPHPSLVAFDAPSREECVVERPRSNTPQQALVLLNDPTYVEAARKLAEKALLEGGKSDDDRLTFLYRRVLSRKPREQETRVLLPLLERHRKQYREDKADVDGLLSIGQAAVSKEVDRTELAAWTSVARVLLNLHETITRE